MESHSLCNSRFVSAITYTKIQIFWDVTPRLLVKSPEDSRRLDLHQHRCQILKCRILDKHNGHWVYKTVKDAFGISMCSIPEAHLVTQFLVPICRVLVPPERQGRPAGQSRYLFPAGAQLFLRDCRGVNKIVALLRRFAALIGSYWRFGIPNRSHIRAFSLFATEYKMALGPTQAPSQCVMRSLFPPG